MWCPIADVTTDGYDMQFGTNVVGHHLLTRLLLPALLEGAKASLDKHARIVHTPRVNLDTPQVHDSEPGVRVIREGLFQQKWKSSLHKNVQS